MSDTVEVTLVNFTDSTMVTGILRWGEGVCRREGPLELVTGGVCALVDI